MNTKMKQTLPVMSCVVTNKGEMVMSIHTVNCTITTYDFAAGYLVDVVDYPNAEELEVYLHHRYYDGIKVHIFDVRKDELGFGGLGELEDVIEGRLVHEPFIRNFEDKYLTGEK